MKKIFLLIIILLFTGFIFNNQVNALSWSENSGEQDCGSSVGGGSMVGPEGNTECHGKYSHYTYQIPISGEITSCHAGDKMVGSDSSTETLLVMKKNAEKCVSQETYDSFVKIITAHGHFKGTDFTKTGWQNTGFLSGSFVFEGLTICKTKEEKVEVTNFNSITCLRQDNTPPYLGWAGGNGNGNGNRGGINPINIDKKGKLINIDVRTGKSDFIVADKYNFYFEILRDSQEDNNGSKDASPIGKIVTEVEQPDGTMKRFDSNGSNGSNIQTSGYIGNVGINGFSQKFDFTSVDNNNAKRTPEEIAGNYREYTYRIIELCDLAGNCSTGNFEIKYRVYANYIDSSNSSKEIKNDDVADGKEKEFKFTLKDEYGNSIVPVKSDDGEIIRNLNFLINYENKVDLNQYEGTGEGIVGTNFSNQTSLDKSFNNFKKVNNNIKKLFDDPLKAKTADYKFFLKPFSPTAGNDKGAQFINSEYTAKINSITVKLNDKDDSDNLLGPTDLKYLPLYYTDILGSLRKNGFIPGTKEESKIKISKNNSVKPTNSKIYLEFGKINLIDKNKKVKHNNLELYFLKDKEKKEIDNNYTFFSNFSNLGNINLITKLLQKNTIEKNEQNSYLATFVQNTFGTATKSVYPSFTLGMNRYNGEIDEWIKGKNENTFQRPLKIIGKLHSSKNLEVSKENVLTNFGNLDKSTLQKFVRKVALQDTFNLKPKDIEKSILNLNSFSDSSGIKIGDTIYYKGKDDNSAVEISGNYNGVKNVVILGGNFYINGDIKASNRKKDILSIIALNVDGKGGKVFIDNNVTNVDAVIYSDKHICSSIDGENCLSPDNGGTYEKLKNQLYIFGSIFSNNTIGGSTGEKPVCPYYININNCTKNESMKYDLYNLRKGYENLYYTNGDKKPYLDENLKEEYENKDVKYATIIEYNPFLQKAGIKFFDLNK